MGRSFFMAAQSVVPDQSAVGPVSLIGAPKITPFLLASTDPQQI